VESGVSEYGKEDLKMAHVIAWMAANALPLSLGAASIGTSLYQGNVQSRRAEHAQEDARNLYNQISLPSSEAVAAQATQNRGALGQARLGAYQNLTRNLASRGFGSGSGLGIKGATDIESAYLKGLGQQQTELTKFANTRQFGPSADVYGYSVPGGIESALGGGRNLLNSALGMYMANKALGGGFNWPNFPAMSANPNPLYPDTGFGGMY